MFELNMKAIEAVAAFLEGELNDDEKCAIKYETPIEREERAERLVGMHGEHPEITEALKSLPQNHICVENVFKGALGLIADGVSVEAMSA